MFLKRQSRSAESVHMPAAENPFIAPAFDVEVQMLPSVSHIARAGSVQWYPPVMIGAQFLNESLVEGAYIEAALSLLQRLTPDDYTQFLKGFYEDGLRRFGSTWRYADIVTVLLCLTDHLKPRSYLEVGVRRGRSAAAVASRAPSCSFTLFDMWTENYAGMPNPGPDFVRQELQRAGYHGAVDFIDGDSHATLPAFFAKMPEATFDLITIDGDHSLEGASLDMRCLLPRLNIGGAIVFDDINHPSHPCLTTLWNRLVVTQDRFSSVCFTDVGYGVGYAIRKW